MAKNRAKKWIQRIRPAKGALHRQLGIPEGTLIPLAVLRAASQRPGTLGRRARLALTLRKLRA